jgi:hypothetical protein
VIEFAADGQQPGTVVRAGDDAIAAQLAAEDLDLCLEEPDASIPTSGCGLDKEMTANSRTSATWRSILMNSG